MPPAAQGSVFPRGPYGLVLALFSWIVFLHIGSLSLFTRGFLLTRLALDTKTACEPSSSCTLPATHKRAVILIIDALRFDFVAPSENLPASRSEYYHDVLTLPRQLTAANPSHSFLFNSYADPPTATLQRIKGITTGSLPTFVDIGGSFGGAGAIEEDSLISQLKAAGKRLAFAGDDTWLTVFPPDATGQGAEAFAPNMSFPYDSFNVEDLHSVDDGVVRHLFPLLDASPTSPDGQWDVFIGHFLGVDHVGHRLGPDHPTMRTKLKQMDTILRQVVQALDDETLLVVLGDHGMDSKGDHGGDNDLETNAALWIYSKSIPLSNFDHTHASSQTHESTLTYVPRSLRTMSLFPGSSIPHRSVQQIDLVPTLALLMGIPIPFNNLGSIIPELFTRRVAALDTHSQNEDGTSSEPSPKPRKASWWGASPSKDEPSSHEPDSFATPVAPGSWSDTLRRASRLNAEQVMTYLKAYRNSASGAELDAKWDELQDAFAFAEVKHAEHNNGQTTMEIMESFLLTRRALLVCTSLWAQFDAPLMSTGLVLLGWSFVALCLVYSRLAATRRGERSPRGVAQWEDAVGELALQGWGGALVGAAVGLVLVAVGLQSWLLTLGNLKSSDVVLSSALFSSLLSILSTLVPSALSASRRYATGRARVSLSRSSTLLPALILILHSASFLSNSFILWEDRVVPYFLVAILLPIFVQSFSAPTSPLRRRLLICSGAAAVIVRLISVSTVCREEQQPYCRVSFYASGAGAGSRAPLAAVLAVLPLGAITLPYLVRKVFLGRSKSDKGVAPFGIDILWRAALVGGSVYWLVEWSESAFAQVDAAAGAPAAGWATASLMTRTVLARIVLGGTLVGAYVFWWNIPLNIEVHVDHQMTNVGESKRVVTVLGFANAYGSAYLLFVLPLFGVLWTATQLSGQVVLALGFIGLMLYIEAVDSARDARALVASFESAETAQSALDALDETSTGAGTSAPAQHARSPTFAEPVFLALFSHLLFFGTGHQAVLSSIQWKTAFVGFPILTYPWSPALVSLNTFGAFVLGAVCVPLVAVWNVSPAQPLPADADPKDVEKATRTPVLADSLRVAVGLQVYYTGLLLGASTSAALLRVSESSFYVGFMWLTHSYF